MAAPMSGLGALTRMAEFLPNTCPIADVRVVHRGRLLNQ
jgi:hypothetical protein